MKKLRENLSTMWLATKYSLAFCWRNNKKDTIRRIAFSVSAAAISYMGLSSAGMIMNAVQHSGGKANVLWLPLGFFIGVQLADLFITRSQQFYQAMWNRQMNYANMRELNHHRSSLGVAVIKSKRYDDLEDQIAELPMGWGVRVAFAEQMLGGFSLFISFLVFGTALLWYKPIYAAILLVVAIPKTISEFGIVSELWGYFERMVPMHKLRFMLERVYKNERPFVQAQMFNQWKPLAGTIAENVQAVLGKFEEMRKKMTRRKTITGVISIIGLSGVVTHAIWLTVVSLGAIGTLSIIMSSARTFQGNLNSLMMLMAEQWNNAKAVILIERDFMGLRTIITTIDPIIPEFTHPHIRFDRVSFAYPNTDKEVLHEVSFDIEAGSKVAIVGKSGNGKSTIQHLLMRDYEPTRGAIYADDINLQNIEPNVWNNFITSLTQDYAIMERKIGEEIASSRLGEPVDLFRVVKSAEFASFDEVVHEEDEGYERQVGSDFGGREFSGGEMQRFALARVAYRGVPILILDEPDARLDPDSADKIMERIFALKGMTVIIITHHVSRAEHCDKVIVMGKGKIEEQGSPSELLSKGGAYARLCLSDKKRLGTQEAEA